jgi:hypothetical protein
VCGLFLLCRMLQVSNGLAEANANGLFTLRMQPRLRRQPA